MGMNGKFSLSRFAPAGRTSGKNNNLLQSLQTKPRFLVCPRKRDTTLADISRPT